MKKFEEKQFTAYYNKLMLATLGVVLLISFALVGLQVRQQARHEEAQLAEQFKTRSIAIDNLIVSVSEHLKLMQRQAEAYFLDPTHGASRLHAALGQTDAVQYSLDQIPLPYAEPDVGNLTGQGSLAHLPPDIHEEMEMALGLNRLFKGVQTNIPNAAWVYYTSQRKFSNIYPWVPSSRARFTEAFYLKPFYSLGLPANNPKREIRWTPLYIDEYGKGMMVTATQPIYRGADFLGTVSIDITLDELTAYVRGFAENTGALMIVNEDGQLIAHPTATSAGDTKIRLFQDTLPEALKASAASLFQAEALKPMRRDAHSVIWYGLTHAPWKVVYVVKEPGVLAGAFSKAGLVFLALLGALTIMIVSMRMVTFREFIRPAESLVRHIFLEGQNKASAVGTQPRQWLPWFGEVSQAFAQNRALLEEINQKNQQLTDMNISLERYTPTFILLLSPAGGNGGTTVGNLFADTLARKDPSKATVYLEFPQPEKVAHDLGIDAAQPIYRHPNGYDIWTSYDLAQMPQAGITSLLMAKVLHHYDNVVISATVQGPAEEFIGSALEPMFRYAKAIVLLVPPQGAEDASVKQMARQIKKNLRQEQAHVYLLSNSTTPGPTADGGAAAGADFDLPFIAEGLRLTKERFDCPGRVGAVIGKLVDRVERVHQIAAFIPTTTAVDQPADTREVVQRTLTYFSELFGGATSSQGEGAWNSEVSGVVNERVHLVVSYITESELSLHADDVIDFIKKIKAELGQEAMAIEINRKLILV